MWRPTELLFFIERSNRYFCSGEFVDVLGIPIHCLLLMVGVGIFLKTDLLFEWDEDSCFVVRLSCIFGIGTGTGRPLIVFGGFGEPKGGLAAAGGRGGLSSFLGEKRFANIIK